MKRVILALAVFITVAVAVEVFAQGTYVRPYHQKDGTYVPGHHRTAPDGNAWNNWSTKGNVNPYTGERGYVDPLKSYESYNPYRQRQGKESQF